MMNDIEEYFKAFKSPYNWGERKYEDERILSLQNELFSLRAENKLLREFIADLKEKINGSK